MLGVFHRKIALRSASATERAEKKEPAVCHGKIALLGPPVLAGFPNHRTRRPSATRGLGLRFRTALLRSTGPSHPKKTACAEPRVAHL